MSCLFYVLETRSLFDQSQVLGSRQIILSLEQGILLCILAERCPAPLGTYRQLQHQTGVPVPPCYSLIAKNRIPCLSLLYCFPSMGRFQFACKNKYRIMMTSHCSLCRAITYFEWERVHRRSSALPSLCANPKQEKETYRFFHRDRRRIICIFSAVSQDPIGTICCAVQRFRLYTID